MFKIIKMYDPAFNGHSTDIFLSLLGMMCLVISRICNYITSMKDDALLFFALSLSAFFIPVIMFFAKWYRGYMIEHDGVYFKYRFVDNKLFYDDIQCIIISNTELYHASTKDPYITLIRDNGKEFIEWYVNKKKNRWLTGEQIRYFLIKANRKKANIKLRYIFKNWSNINSYGFRWNKKYASLLLENYNGTYYIARSIYERYEKEIRIHIQQYNINESRVNVIDDLN